MSRPQNEIFEEAADLAYYFHWSRTEIMSMTGKERTSWLKQIKRIHSIQDKKKNSELLEQMQLFSDSE
ncbi:MAG: GpE family phage tail protein [Treponema sp.]|nr:GpE family phage tail protein [Treponema sp.]